MNDMKSMITLKRVLLGTLMLVVFLFVVSFVRSVMMPMGGMFDDSYAVARVANGTVTFGRSAGSARLQAIAGFDKGVSYDAMEVASPPIDAPLPTSPASPPMNEAKIIKSGNLTLLVKNTEDAAQKISDIRVALGGQEGNANFTEYSPGVKTGYITIWVPADKFGEAMIDIKKIALGVENESMSVQDVSAQFVDISSRLKNLHAAEAAYVEIMKRSGKISEVLEVTRALNDTRSQIEQLQGQLDYLSRQVALSAISISLRQEATLGVVTNEWRPITVMKAAAKQALGDFTDFVDMLLVMLVRLPIILLYLAWYIFLFWLVYRAAKFLYHRLKQSSMFAPKQS